MSADPLTGIGVGKEQVLVMSENHASKLISAYPVKRQGCFLYFFLAVLFIKHYLITQMVYAE